MLVLYEPARQAEWELASGTTTPPDSPLEPESKINTPATTTPTTPILLPATADIVSTSFSLAAIPRFFHLLTHAKTLIQVYGPHTTYSETTIFARAPVPRSTKTTKPASAKLLATSLAAAQDSIHTPQPAGPAREDLQIFKLLWDAAVDVLEKMLEEADLDHESFGWGVFGLSSGYISASATASVSKQNDDQMLEPLKQRLHDALRSLPSMTSPEHGRQSYAVCGAERVNQLAKARRQIHVCASLLMQKVRAEGWSRVRWWHGVAIAERWIGHTGLAHSCMWQEEREDEFGWGI